VHSFPREVAQRTTTDHLCSCVPSPNSPTALQNFRRREERKKKSEVHGPRPPKSEVMLVGTLGYVDPEYANHATLLYVKPHSLSHFFFFSCLTASAQRPTMTDVVAQLQPPGVPPARGGSRHRRRRRGRQRQHQRPVLRLQCVRRRR
jgi:hypothetical protein